MEGFELKGFHRKPYKYYDNLPKHLTNDDAVLVQPDKVLPPSENEKRDTTFNKT